MIERLIKRLEEELEVKVEVYDIDLCIFKLKILLPNKEFLITRTKRTIFEEWGEEYTYQFLKGEILAFWNGIIFKEK